MIEHRCDHCKAMMPDCVLQGSIHIHGLEFYLNDYTGQSCKNVRKGDYDLCDVCAKEFLTWLRGESQ